MIETTFRVDADRVWLATFGNDGNGFAYWCGALRSADGGDFDAWVDTSIPVAEWRPNPQDFMAFDFEDDTWYDVSVEQLAQGYASALSEYPELFAEPDASTEDAIMQFAIFGELLYG